MSLSMGHKSWDDVLKEYPLFESKEAEKDKEWVRFILFTSKYFQYSYLLKE